MGQNDLQERAMEELSDNGCLTSLHDLEKYCEHAHASLVLLTLELHGVRNDAADLAAT